MKTCDANGACEGCYRSKERCQLAHNQPSCSRCSRLGKVCRPRTKKRFGRPPIVKKFDHGTSGLFSFRGVSQDHQTDKFMITHLSRPTDPNQTAMQLLEPVSTRTFEEPLLKSYGAFRPETVLSQKPLIQYSSHKQLDRVLVTEDGFFNLHRHWLIARSLSSNYHHTVRRLFSHSPIILANAYQIVLEMLSVRNMEFKGAMTKLDFVTGANCLRELVQSSGSLRSVEDAATVLMLGQILFVYNLLISWPCTHIIIRNTLLTTMEWYPEMLKNPEWDPATLTPVFVDTIQCLVGREIPVIRLLIEGRVVVDRFLGVSSSLLPLLYDLCVCSYRVKTYAPAPKTPPFSIDMQKADDDVYSTVERQINSWEPVLPPRFFTEFTDLETFTLLAQARMYKTAGLILIHRLRHPLGVHDEVGKRYAESILYDLTTMLRIVGRQGASGIGSNFLLLLVTIELPGQESSLIQIFEHFRFGPKQYVQISKFAEYVKLQQKCGFDGLWFDLAKSGLFEVTLP